MNDVIKTSIDSHIQIISNLKAAQQEIKDIANVVFFALMRGRSIFWYGNGGSAADSQHMAAELVSRFKAERRALRSQALTTDTSILTAIGNDYTFEDIFKRQVEAAVGEGDVCIGLSTSGNSKNIYHAHLKAKELGAKTVSFLGNDGGCIKQVSDYSIVIPSNDTPRIQEAHTLIAHIVCDIVEQLVVEESGTQVSKKVTEV